MNYPPIIKLFLPSIFRATLNIFCVFFQTSSKAVLFPSASYIVYSKVSKSSPSCRSNDLCKGENSVQTLQNQSVASSKHANKSLPKSKANKCKCESTSTKSLQRQPFKLSNLFHINKSKNSPQSLQNLSFAATYENVDSLHQKSSRAVSPLKHQKCVIRAEQTMIFVNLKTLQTTRSTTPNQ